MFNTFQHYDDGLYVQLLSISIINIPNIIHNMKYFVVGDLLILLF